MKEQNRDQAPIKHRDVPMILLGLLIVVIAALAIILVGTPLTVVQYVDKYRDMFATTQAPAVPQAQFQQAEGGVPSANAYNENIAQ